MLQHLTVDQTQIHHKWDSVLKKSVLILFLLITLFTLVLLFACKREPTKPDPPAPVVPGTLNVRFYINELWDPTPTRQTVIWLEDTEGYFVRSLFVSAWLAYGGYSHSEVCPEWNSRADWKNVDQEQFDSVTRATPDWGAQTIEQFQLDSLGVAAGDYRCRIETHIKDDYNISYTGQIEVKQKNNSVTPDPTYYPSRHEKAGDLLNSVQMEYVPHTE